MRTTSMCHKWLGAYIKNLVRNVDPEKKPTPLNFFPSHNSRWIMTPSPKIHYLTRTTKLSFKRKKKFKAQTNGRKQAYHTST